MAVLSVGGMPASAAAKPRCKEKPLCFEARPVAGAGTASVGADLYNPVVTAARRCTSKGKGCRGVGNPHGTPALYVTGHGPGAGGAEAESAGAPSFVSVDGGKTWGPLEGPVKDVPADTRSGGGSSGIAVDPEGRAWQLDFGASSGSVTEWTDYGVSRSAQYAAYGFGEAIGCRRRGIEQAWIASAGHDRLLLVTGGTESNLAANWAFQVGSLRLAGANVAGNPTWGPCGEPGPAAGVPAARPDGTFAVPRHAPTADTPELSVLVGDLDGLANGSWQPGSEPKWIQLATGGGSNFFGCTARATNWGNTAFSRDGTLFAAVVARPEANSSEQEIVVWRLSGAGGRSVEAGQGSSSLPGEMVSLWLSGSQRGDGALLTYSVLSDPGDCSKRDYYAAHVTTDRTGDLEITNNTLVADDVGGQCGDYAGSSLGPDGYAYLAVYTGRQHDGQCLGNPGGSAITVYAQTSGPKL